MNQLIIVLLIINFLFLGCDRHDSTPSSSGALAGGEPAPIPQKPLIPFSEAMNKIAPQVSLKEYPTYTQTDIITHRGLLRITNRGWCQEYHDAYGTVYCVLYDHTKIEQNGKTTYFYRRAYRKPENYFEYKVEATTPDSKNFWDGNAELWKQSDEFFGARELRKFEFKIDIDDYYKYLQDKHNLLTSKCLGYVNYKLIREFTVEKQGNLVVNFLGMFLLNTSHFPISSALEVDVQTWDVKYISTIKGGGNENYDVRPLKLVVEEILTSRKRYIYMDNPRRAAAARIFNWGCRSEYIGRRYIGVCPEHADGWSYPAYDPDLDPLLSKMLNYGDAQKNAVVDLDEDFLSSSATFPINDPAQYWGDLPGNKHSRLPAWCMEKQK